MSDKKKLNKEQLKQLEELQDMLKKGALSSKEGAQQGKIPNSKDELAAMMQNAMLQQRLSGGNKPNLYTMKGLLIAMLSWMNNGVKFIDQFSNFIVNRHTTDSNDVIDSSRSPIIFGFWVVFIFVFLGLIWAATAPLDSAAVAIGTVISDTKKRIINHQEGGIIQEIYVHVGDEVKAGDKLIKLDDKRVRSDFEAIQSRYRGALAAYARLQAEINEKDQIEFPKLLLDTRSDLEVSKILETQENLFRSKVEAYKGEEATVKQRIMQFNKQIEGLEARKVATKKSLEVVQDRLDATKKLNAKGYAQKAALLDLEDREARALSEIAITDTEIAKTEQQITEAEISLVNLHSKNIANALSELKDIQTQIPELAERYIELEDKISRSLITSSVDGVVNKLEYTTNGMSIQAIAPIMEISPKDDKLVIEAKIHPKDINSISVGLHTKMKFSAYKSRVSPTFFGKIVSISPDIVDETPRGQFNQQFPQGYYLATVEIDMEDFHEKAASRDLVLKPGMGVEVQIVTGERTLLRYLMDPVLDAMFKGFKEK